MRSTNHSREIEEGPTIEGVHVCTTSDGSKATTTVLDLRKLSASESRIFLELYESNTPPVTILTCLE